LYAIACVVVSLAACHGANRPRTAFDGLTALGYVKTQLDFGPRIPGTPGAQRCGDWIIAQMRRRADTVIVQSWTYRTAAGVVLPLRNILARFRPTATDRVLYVTHWDTRPVSDEATDSAERRLPVPGANDGASGVALFVALGDVLKKTPPSVGVDLLFVDGEDYGDFTKNQDVLLGSTYFASHLPAPDYHPIFGVLWDMIGDRDLEIYQEGNSIQKAPEVVTRVWGQAGDLGYGRYFIPQYRYTVTDDHVPLLKAGLRVIDVIDFQYPPHHTPQDTFDKVSSESLQIVGDVATALVQ
jgi:Zn-dependent M28 family amino/carboxypeptidase